MTQLTSRQRAHLRSLAHPLKPLFQIGKEGVTENSARTIGESFNTRELIKIKVHDSAPQEARESGEALVALIPDAHLVQVIGKTLVVYRPHPDNPEIRLPRPKSVD